MKWRKEKKKQKWNKIKLSKIEHIEPKDRERKFVYLNLQTAAANDDKFEFAASFFRLSSLLKL